MSSIPLEEYLILWRNNYCTYWFPLYCTSFADEPWCGGDQRIVHSL